MKLSFTIPMQLPGMNDIIARARKHHMASAAQKKTWTTTCAVAVGRVIPLRGPVAVMFDWHDTGRRDPDNVMAGQKFIFDGLVARGAIPDDDYATVRSISHRFHLDALNPRVDVVVYEVAPSEEDG